MPGPQWNNQQPPPPVPGQQPQMPQNHWGQQHQMGQMGQPGQPGNWQNSMNRWNGQNFPNLGNMLQNSPFGGLFGENGLGRFFGPDGMMGRINPNMGQFINQNLSGLQNIPFIGSLFGGGPIAQPPHEIAGIPPDQQNVS